MWHLEQIKVSCLWIEVSSIQGFPYREVPLYIYVTTQLSDVGAIL